MPFFVYILASGRNGTLHIGMTDNLARRIWEHQTDAVAGFTRKYAVKTWFGSGCTTRGRRLFSADVNLRNGNARGRSN
jgi:predicted GIY-YIG superfamily endonuclease